MANIENREAKLQSAELLNKQSATVLAAASFGSIDANGDAVAAADTSTGNIFYSKEGAAAGELQVGVVSDDRTIYEVDVTTTLADTHRGLLCGFDASGVVDQTNTADEFVKIVAGRSQDSLIGTSKALVKIIATL